MKCGCNAKNQQRAAEHKPDCYAWISQEYFDATLAEIIGEFSGVTLLQVPGAYEVFSEHFNNDVLHTLDELHRGEED